MSVTIFDSEGSPEKSGGNLFHYMEAMFISLTTTGMNGSGFSVRMVE